MSGAGQSPEEVYAEVEPVLRAGLELEGQIFGAQQAIREQSKQACGHTLLDGRLMLMGAVAHAMNAKSGIAGKTDPAIAQQLVLLASFFQGVGATETLIMEGQYIKAAAALKQDLEILARIGEVVAGVAKPGKTPNVKYAPGTGRMYGQLNNAAHPSNEELLEDLLDQAAVPGGAGVSPIPYFNGDTAVALYELHVYLLTEVTRELMRIMFELYGEAVDLSDGIRLWDAATALLEKHGHIKKAPTG
jgi:hypothetical protein